MLVAVTVGIASEGISNVITQIAEGTTNQATETQKGAEMVNALGEEMQHNNFQQYLLSSVIKKL